MKIYLFKTYTIDPMINSWNEWYPHIKVLGLFAKSMFIIRLIYFIKGYSSFSGGGKIIRYSVTEIVPMPFENPILERHKWVEPKLLDDDDDCEEFGESK